MATERIDVTIVGAEAMALARAIKNLACRDGLSVIKAYHQFNHELIVCINDSYQLCLRGVRRWQPKDSVRRDEWECREIFLSASLFQGETIWISCNSDFLGPTIDDAIMKWLTEQGK